MSRKFHTFIKFLPQLSIVFTDIKLLVSEQGRPLLFLCIGIESTTLSSWQIPPNANSRQITANRRNSIATKALALKVALPRFIGTGIAITFSIGSKA